MTENQKISTIEDFKSTAHLASNPGFQSTLSVASKETLSDEKPYNPFENRNVKHPNTTLGSILHFLKACLGSGILAMPAAFKNAGLAAGSVGTAFVGLLCTHTVHILVKTSQDVCVDAKKPSMGFAETCEAAFAYGPKRLQPWAPFLKTIVDYSLVLTYFSVLCVYVVFIGSSFKEVLDVLHPEETLSIQTYCALSLVPLILICQIRNLKYLVPFSLVANILVIVVFAITLYYVFVDLPPLSEREMVADITQWPLFFSTVVFAMEGIGVVMPVENEMANPQRFLGCPGVLNVAMVIVISLYGIVGFFGYIQYGNDAKGSVTLNLPQDDMIAQSAKLLMALVIYFSYALQFYIPMDMINRKLRYLKASKFYNLIQIGIRTLLVTMSVGIAAAFPNLELIIGFVGAIFFSTLGFLIPAIVETVYRWDRDLGCCKYVVWKNIIISAFAIFALVSGAYTSIDGIVKDFFADNEIYDNSTAQLTPTF